MRKYITILIFVIQLLPALAFGFAGPFKGKITDENAVPLVGASVAEKGTTNTVFTTDNGNFTINLTTSSPVLVISYVGYGTKEVSVGDSSTLTIKLSAAAQDMNSVVVVGYGTQKKSRVTGAVASANLQIMKDAPNTNIIQSLQGNVPGLNVGPVTSAGSTPSISIRGTNTISGSTSVLIILDGVQYNGSLSSINPDDIASIDVLKDASSTAVYGAQAANGVLLVTSRKGTNRKARITFSSSYATQNPAGTIRPLNREEYLNKVRDLYWDSAYLAPDYTQPNPAYNPGTKVDLLMREIVNGVPTVVSTDFNWWDAGTNQGYINDNQLSVSGASDRFNYLISGAYTNQKGFIINDLFKRKSLRLNLEAQATDWLKLGVQSFGSFVNADGAEPDVSSLFLMSPLQTPYLPNGNLNPYPFNSVDPNPFLSYDITDYERHNYLFANIYSEVNFPFLRGLTYRVNFGNNARQDNFYSASKYGAGLTGSASKTNSNYYDYTLDNILTFNRTFNEHSITATLLYGAIERKQESTSATGTGFPRLTLGYNALAQATVQRISSSGYQEALNYQMIRANYMYGGKYVLTGTIRRDGYSAFAENNKWGIFPSLSGGWLISQENFLKNQKALNLLKIRVGYGISGNQTSRYSSIDRTETRAAYVFGDGGTTVFGQNPATLANSNLRWEKTAELNTGFDFGILNNRISGSFDYYVRNTNDLLFTVQIPNITGFSSIPSNVGRVGNTGFELSINTKNIQQKNLNWNTTFNLSRSRSKVKELLGSGDLVASNLFIGQPFGSIYGYETAGIYQLKDAIPAGYYPGTYRVVDRNKDGAVNANDRYVLGTSEPAYRFSIINSLQYKGLTFTFLVNSIQGGKNSYLGSNSPSIGRSDVSIRNGGIAGIDYWTPANPTGTAALWRGGSPTINPGIYFSRSFVRLQDVSLSYRLPATWTKRVGVQDFSLFVSGKNLYTWTKWKGWDPETGAGLVRDGRPVLRGFSFGANITLQ